MGNWPTGDLRADSISRDLQPGRHFVDRGDLMPFVGAACRNGGLGGWWWVGSGGRVSDSTWWGVSVGLEEGVGEVQGGWEGGGCDRAPVSVRPRGRLGVALGGV